jgi:hypothetical protein
MITVLIGLLLDVLVAVLIGLPVSMCVAVSWPGKTAGLPCGLGL